MRHYDPKNNRLIYLAEHASPEYWDRHWETADLRREITRKHYDFLVLPTTRDYLSPGSRILEGGCGTGVHVYNLQRHDYQSVGIDNAPETVRRAKEAVPEMDIQLGDVRALQFPDNHFDGYWSIGVIEHFWNGYDEVLKEMRRVLKPGGYLFLTFPYMSPLRRWKAGRGRYKILKPQTVMLNSFQHLQTINLEIPKQVRDDSVDSIAPSALQNDITAPQDFYQFALDHHNVTKTFEQNGFELVETKPFDGWNGLASEVPIKLRSKFIRLAIDFLARPFAGHAMLLVLQKK